MKIKLLINIILIFFLWFFESFSKASDFRAVIKSNFERTTWFSETSETAIPENQLEKSLWQ
ncbi:hypothetical protein BCT16_08330 [Vibrio sp. 10N.222.54.B6]|nr:hypothetical protein BCU05_15435 [Vibrio sp. 10N.261.54.C3]PMN97383.1 hypothetical protein BCT20_17445 [Vibrio sp. 10N.222.55.C12]PMO09097.1 hypothetical protein BCT17_03745 [Vibrio sp. 10N.222.54.F10]PMO20843.1 hypothetical protein BCT16_08330 [Vibrio sp. 10N.222.54.B6]TKF35521.1 hypothetical protein FCV57_20425 [Vibrio sp. F13]